MTWRNKVQKRSQIRRRNGQWWRIEICTLQSKVEGNLEENVPQKLRNPVTEFPYFHTVDKTLPYFIFFLSWKLNFAIRKPMKIHIQKNDNKKNQTTKISPVDIAPFPETVWHYAGQIDALPYTDIVRLLRNEQNTWIYFVLFENIEIYHEKTRFVSKVTVDPLVSLMVKLPGSGKLNLCTSLTQRLCP